MIKLDDIIEKVRLVVNEYQGGETDTFTEESGALIAAHIDSAVRSVASVVPMRYLNPTSIEQDVAKTLRPDGRYVITVEVPSDCMRMGYISHTELKRPVVEFVTAMDQNYAAEWCEVPGIGSGAYNPKGYVWSKAGGETIEIHSVASDGTLAKARMVYVKVPVLGTVDDTANAYDVDGKLKDAIAYTAGALYLGSIGSQGAGNAMESAKTALGALGVMEMTADATGEKEA